MVSLVSSFVQHSARILTFAIIRQALPHFPDIQEGIPIIHAGRPTPWAPALLTTVRQHAFLHTYCVPTTGPRTCLWALSESTHATVPISFPAIKTVLTRLVSLGTWKHLQGEGGRNKAAPCCGNALGWKPEWLLVPALC